MPLDYDPLLAKLTVHAPDRTSAIARTLRALAEYAVTGVTTNLAFFDDLLRDSEFIAGRLHTGFLIEFMARRPQHPPDPLLDHLAAAVAAVHTRETGPGQADAGSAARFPMGARRKEGPVAMMWHVTLLTGDARVVAVDLAALPDLAEVEPGVYSALEGGRSYQLRIAHVGGAHTVDVGNRRLIVDATDPHRRAPRRRGAREGRQNLTAAMPGKVIRVLVSAGDMLEAGQGVVVVEAMKMQNEVKAAARRPGGGGSRDRRGDGGGGRCPCHHRPGVILPGGRLYPWTQALRRMRPLLLPRNRAIMQL